MNSLLRNILGIIVGAGVGGFINGQIIKYGHLLVPLPEGVNPENIDSINANIASYEPQHFIMPFLAHALGTLVGAFIVTKIAASNQKIFALGIGALFLMGGIMVAQMLSNSPIWFTALDIIGAYIPMALLGYHLAKKD